MLNFQSLIAQSYETHLIKNGSTSLNTRVYPKANAESVILLHGGPGVPDPMTEIALELNQKYQVITFQQRGTGLSSNPDSSYSISAYISDIDVIADYLGLASFHLFGHSWGGLYAQIYAEAKPKKIKSLFLCSPSSGTNAIWKATEKEVMDYNKRNASSGEWIRMGWYSLLGMLGSDKAYEQTFYLVMRNYHKSYTDISVNREQLRDIRATPINKTRKSIVAYKALSLMPKPAFPIMITYGEGDIYGASKQEVIDRYPTAQVLAIKESGHIPWIHNPDVFGQTLDRFYFLDETLIGRNEK